MAGFFDFFKNQGSNTNLGDSNFPATNNNLSGTVSYDSDTDQGVIKNQSYSGIGPTPSGVNLILELVLLL